MQKLGAGYQALLLYRRDGNRFLPATERPLGDLAWDYFFTLPASKGMRRDQKDPYSLDHMQANLLKGMEKGEHWPESRYVVFLRHSRPGTAHAVDRGLPLCLRRQNGQIFGSRRFCRQ